MEDLETNKKIKYKLVGQDEADISKNLIYFKSPIGKALIGKEIDEMIAVNTPSGERNFEILKVDYEWFKFVHNKNDVNGLTPLYNNNDFLQTYKQGDAYYLGGYKQSRIWHYYEKETMENLDARIF